MKIDEAFQHIEVLYHSIRPSHPDLAYEIVKAYDEAPFKDWFWDEIPAPGCSKKSGIYIFSNIDRDILYIGKADPDNFGSVIYSKFGPATSLDEKGDPFFEESRMAKWASKEYAEYFLRGNVCVTAIEIHPKEFTSLFEAYLQTCFAIRNEFPPLNRQIG